MLPVPARDGNTIRRFFPILDCSILFILEKMGPEWIQSHHHQGGMPGGGDPLSLLTRHFLDAGRGSMRKLVLAACAAGLAIGLSSATATAASASPSVPAWGPGVIVVGPNQSIQAAVNKAHPGETVFLLPGVYHQTVQIRTDDITLRGSGAFKG